MWKYVVIWGLYVMGTVNEPDSNYFGQPGFERVGTDSAVFYDRDSAFAYSDHVQKNWLTPPHNQRGRCFKVHVDSVYIEPERKLNFIQKLFYGTKRRP